MHIDDKFLSNSWYAFNSSAHKSFHAIAKRASPGRLGIFGFWCLCDCIAVKSGFLIFLNFFDKSKSHLVFSNSLSFYDRHFFFFIMCSYNDHCFACITFLFILEIMCSSSTAASTILCYIVAVTHTTWIDKKLWFEFFKCLTKFS